jgi:hypothetical protein
MNYLKAANKWLETTPHAGQNFGGLHDAYYWFASSFPRRLALITLESDGDAGPNTAPGVYTISIGDAGGGIGIYEAGSHTNQDPTLGTFEVTITPEPASILLLVGALPFLRRRRSA